MPAHERDEDDTRQQSASVLHALAAAIDSDLSQYLVQFSVVMRLRRRPPVSAAWVRYYWRCLAGK